MLISQDEIRRNMLNVVDGENTSITAEKDMENIVKDIYDTLLNTDKF